MKTNGSVQTGRSVQTSGSVQTVTCGLVVLVTCSLVVLVTCCLVVLLTCCLVVFVFVLQKERVTDFKEVIIKYLESLVQTQQQVACNTATLTLT